MTSLSDITLQPFSFGSPNEPEQRLAIASISESGQLRHGVWECGPGEFSLDFSWSETAYIIEGRAEIENLDTGEKYFLSKGSMISFEKNSRWRWRIPWRIKKIFTTVAWK